MSELLFATAAVAAVLLVVRGCEHRPRQRRVVVRQRPEVPPPLVMASEVAHLGQIFSQTFLGNVAALADACEQMAADAPEGPLKDHARELVEQSRRGIGVAFRLRNMIP